MKEPSSQMTSQKKAGKNKALGHEIYSKAVLTIYDLLVIHISSPLVWKCPSHQMLKQYQKLMSSEHLDVGVGTGYYLKKVKKSKNINRLGLLDLNPNCLEHVAKHFHTINTEIYRVNALEPINISTKPFESIGLNYLLHCLPGNLPEKARIFDHLIPFSSPGTVIFGSTILAKGVKVNPTAQRLMNFYNHKNIFSNLNDSLEDLNTALKSRFDDVSIKVNGCVALFTARV